MDFGQRVRSFFNQNRPQVQSKAQGGIGGNAGHGNVKTNPNVLSTPATISSIGGNASTLQNYQNKKNEIIEQEETNNNKPKANYKPLLIGLAAVGGVVVLSKLIKRK